MDNLDKYFKGQQRDEELICFFRQHWIVILKDLISLGIFILVTVLLIFNLNPISSVLAGNTGFELLFLGIFVFLTVYMHRVFLHLLNYFISIGIITDIRVLEHRRTLFLHDTMEAVDLAQIQNIERVGEGFLPNLLNYGDIKIFLNASNAVMIFSKITNVKFHFRAISRAKEARQTYLMRLAEADLQERSTTHPTLASINQITDIAKIKEHEKNTLPTLN